MRTITLDENQQRDADGPYILLAGISAVLVALATIRYARHHPFPRPGGTHE